MAVNADMVSLLWVINMGGTEPLSSFNRKLDLTVPELKVELSVPTLCTALKRSDVAKSCSGSSRSSIRIGSSSRSSSGS